MRVLFIYTDIGISTGYSCGIGILSACLKKAGHETKLLHVSEEMGYPFSPDRIAQDVLNYHPGLICFSVATNQWFFVKKIAKIIRSTCTIPIIVGGHHANGAAEQIMKEESIDFVCRGEGEGPLVTLVERLEKTLPVADIPNMVWREKGQVHWNPLRSWVRNLDELPFEDYNLFDYKHIIETRDGWAEVILSRGCPYRCSYCFNKSYFEMYQNDLLHHDQTHLRVKDFIRYRSVDKSLALLHELRGNFPTIKGFTFVDDILARKGPWFEEFCHRYKKEIGLPFACTSQPLLFNREVAALLADAGCKVVKLGIEAGDLEIRKKILARNISNGALKSAFTIAREYHLKPQAFNMIGLPTETKGKMLETARLNSEVRPYIVWLSTFMPYPGTELYDFCREHDLINEEKWDEMTSYRGDTVLKETFISNLEFNKVRTMFKWYLNAFLNNEVSKTYQKHIDELDRVSGDCWINGEAQKMYLERDIELDKYFRQKRYGHYVSKKYLFIFWDKMYDYDLS